MPKLKTHVLIAVAAIAASSLTQNSLADVLTCTEKYQQYAQAQTLWQNQSAHRAAQLLPDNAERIYQYRDTQLMGIARRKLAVEVALQNYPEQVASWGSINQWINLTPEFEAKLNRHSPEYQKLSAEYQEQTTQPVTDKDKDFPVIYRKTVLADAEFMQLMKDFNLKSRELNSLNCTKKATD